MAYPVGWGRKCSLAIQSSQVDSNLSNFPVLLNEDTLPSEMFDADGSYPALNGGGDIRFSSDSAGATQLACEVVSFVTDNDPANGTAEIYVKIPSVSSSSNTTIYIWYNKAGESQPAASDTYGSQNAWDDNYKIVAHLSESGDGTTSEYKDSTSNALDGTGGNGVSGACPDLASGVQDFITANSDTITFESPGITGANARTFSCFVKFDILGYGLICDGAATAHPADDGKLATLFSTSDEIGFHGFYADATTASADIVVDTWYWINGKYTGTDIKININGVEEATNTATWNTSARTYLDVGKHTTNYSARGSFDGKMGELRISNIARSDDWLKSEYSNQNSPSGFVVEGTPESTSITFAGDANLKSTESATFTGDANLKLTKLVTFVGDANFKLIESATFTGDASLKSIESATFTGDSFLETRVTATYTGDTNLKITLSSTFTGDANLKREYEFTGDASLKSVESTIFTGDANLKATEAVTFTGDATLGNGAADSFTGDSSLKSTESATFTGDARLKVVIESTFTGDSELLKIYTFTGDANLNAEIAVTYIGDANLKTTLSSVFTGDASLRSIESLTFTSDANLKKEIAATFTGDAVLKIVIELTFTSDSNLLKVYTFTGDANLRKISTSNFAGIITLDNKQQSYGFGFSGGIEFPLR